MSNPVELNADGAGTTFPTWAAGGTTTLWVENLDNSKAGQVSVNAGAAQEYVDVSPGNTTSIKRKWGGIIIGVTNSGQSRVKVWTA